MDKNYRGQCNLHLYLAGQYLAEYEAADTSKWGGHYQQACRESSMGQLYLAYQAHIADVITQQPLFPLVVPGGRFNAQFFADAEVPPELAELCEREKEAGWLCDMLSHDSLAAAAPAVDQNLIARDLGRVAESRELAVAQWLQELQSLVSRHRAVLMEY
ncbi:MAG: DUF6586 family protein [Spongiibacteraceae bacterium]